MILIEYFMIIPFILCPVVRVKTVKYITDTLDSNISPCLYQSFGILRWNKIQLPRTKVKTCWKNRKKEKVFNCFTQQINCIFFNIFAFIYIIFYLYISTEFISHEYKFQAALYHSVQFSCSVMSDSLLECIKLRSHFRLIL